MQRRLLAFFLPTFLLTAAVLGSLLSAESARRISLDAELQRHTDAEALLNSVVAAAADIETGDAGERLLPTPDPEREDVDRYLMIDGLPTTPDQRPQGRAIERIDQALAEDTVVWPWTSGDFATTATAPIGTDGTVAELLVLEPVDQVRDAVTRRWVVIAAAVATTVAFIALGTYPLTRWALRPIHHIDETARALAGGDMSARAITNDGPPEIRRLAVSLNAMAERVAAGLHRERAFVASASHHFGNLLTPLRLRMETIDHARSNADQGAGGDPEDTGGNTADSSIDRTAATNGNGDHTVEEALAELDRLESAAERLLQLNRAEENGLQPTVVDVGPIVDESLRSWQVVAVSRDIALRRKGSAHAYAWASPGAIEETLDNLIDNAMKYAEGSEITLSVVRGLHNVRVMVSDRGPGLSDEEIEHAQGRFWRGPTHQNKPGSGLGLAIVDALAAQSGAHFELRNSPDGGLEAALVLKRAHDAP